MCNHEPKKTVTGVYGGSFNPIHMGHTSMAEEILRQGLTDEVWLVVSPQNPLKDNGLWPDALRLELATKAVGGLAGIKVSDIEFGMPRPNYMINTLHTLSGMHPEREFVLIIGMDNWECFHRWHKWEDILSGYRIIVLPRQTVPDETPSAFPPPPPGARVHFANLPLINISSTWIRSQMDNNPSYCGQGLHPEVWNAIRLHRK